MKSRSLFLGSSLITFIFLIFITIFLNNLIFKQQLNYGFRDVDWSMLYYYKLFGSLSLNHLIQSYKLMGAYTYEIYYVGILEKMFGLNFSMLHQATQIFKIITALCIYVFILKVFKRKLLAFLSSLIYTVSYTHAGALFMLATGGYFFASIFMILLFLSYYQALTHKNSFSWVFVSNGLLILTLILNTERMYPLLLIIPTIEIGYLYFNKWKKAEMLTSCKRLLVVFLPIILFAFIYNLFLKSSIVNAGFGPSQFFVSSKMRFISISQGNLQLLFYPFASLGSIFLYSDYWKILGNPNFSSFSNYLSFIIFGPLLRIGLLTLLLLPVIYKKSLKISAIVTTCLLIFSLLFYFVYINWQNINPATRIYFDPNLSILPTLWGFYIFVINILLAFSWFKNKNIKLIPPVLGLVFAMLFIFLTWIASDVQLLFMGPQRYLSIPSIGISIFISGLLVLIIDKMHSINFTRRYSLLILIILVPLIYINYQVANDFFNMELNFGGMRGSDQEIMKSKLRNIAKDISPKEKTLFYFDETSDKQNDYFNESTVLAGFEFWMRLDENGNLNNLPEPGMMRTNVQCPLHTHNNCMEIMSKNLAKINGEEGIWYKDSIRGKGSIFYKTSNLYAIRFINKDLINIKDEVLKDINSNDTP